MKRLVLSVLAMASLAAAAAPASAAPWLSINQRQASLDQRIDKGIKNGALTRSEAVRLRGEFRQIAALETRYRMTGGGLDARERADLDRRMDGLSRQVYVQRHDGQRQF